MKRTVSLRKPFLLSLVWGTAIIVYIIGVDTLYRTGQIKLDNLLYVASGYLTLPGLFIQAIVGRSLWGAIHSSSYISILVTSFIFYVTVVFLVLILAARKGTIKKN